MKWLKVLGSILLVAVLIVPMYSTNVTASEEKPEKLRVLISSSDEVVKAKAKANYGVRWDFKKNGFTTDVNEKQLEALKKNKNINVKLIDKISLDAKPGSSTSARTAVPNDQTPWGIEAIYNDSAITKPTGGSGVKVAVLDTGVNTSHVDLAGSAEQCKDFTQRKSNLVNNFCSDKNGHGTHVAGTVLAHGGNDGSGIYGVAPESDLWAYKVLNDRGSGYSDDIAAAIQHAADEANRLNANVIISMSLGSSSKSTLIADAVSYAYNKGVLVVAAAGNSGPNANTIGYPGALVDAVAVAALEDVQENGTYRVADFSSRGNPDTDGDFVIEELDVEVSAPGRAIESTWYDGTYNTISGTSMATPHISGLAAKIWAANTSLTASDIRLELQKRATANDILGGSGSASGDDYASGFGFPTVK
ncbi:subtilisin [Bacillus mesophilus]|uniref:S8 family serine peptidase n=1 Tax=Bacillus mesophilus TaxID=1808955 RepID=A0A6M0Q284_9BACI|nr:S8 family serine peptidase [Bacillus mesophilus]MBM7659622.1 subtilisin [Bacillus mesophilus]NEY70491.1 S8 family serine peptidase [Bacillus mesophilus]